MPHQGQDICIPEATSERAVAHPGADADDAARAVAPLLGEFSSDASPLPPGHILGEDLGGHEDTMEQESAVGSVLQPR